MGEERPEGGIMPAEVLSYFLKNSDLRLRLAFQVVLQCAPFLKGLKVSCVISVDAALYGVLEELFKETEIAWYRLSESEGKCLVLFYRPAELEKYLNSSCVNALAGEYGYGGMPLYEMLRRLKNRVRTFAERGMGFPHEIGIFLGYPEEDIRGFIENRGQRYRMTGYWKVYGDTERAGMIFREYDRAKDCAVNEFLTGKSIREIAAGQ